MNLEQFAIDAGVEIVECDISWGGRIAYRTKDAPNCKMCGFRTKASAYKNWLEDTFGADTAKAVRKLLKSSNMEPAGTQG